MKTKITGLLHVVLLAMIMLGFSMANAQTATGADNVAQGDALGVSIKLVDNKGTIKYMQSNNGITTITSTEAGEATTTTWQLGGTLIDDTHIDLNGQVFAIDGLTQETGAAANGVTIGVSGWTILVRDEATGNTKKMLATDLIQSGQATYTALAGDETADALTVPAVGLSTEINQVWVYRNGAKLIKTDDFVIAADAVTVTGNINFSIYTDDIIEVQWVQ